jgi:hypothetical protein
MPNPLALYEANPSAMAGKEGTASWKTTHRLHISIFFRQLCRILP